MIGMHQIADTSPDDATIAHVLSARDPYTVLSLPSNAGAEAIRTAFKRCARRYVGFACDHALHLVVLWPSSCYPRLALQLHPDKCKAYQAAEAFAAVAAAASQLLQHPPVCSDRDASWWHAFAAPQHPSAHRHSQSSEKQSPAPDNAWSAPCGTASTSRPSSTWQRSTTWHAPCLHTGSASPRNGAKQVVTLVSDDSSPELRLPTAPAVQPRRRTTQGNLDAWLQPSHAIKRSSEDDSDSSDGSNSDSSNMEQNQAASPRREAGQQVLHRQQSTAALRAAQVLQRKERLRQTIARMHKKRRRRRR